MPRTKQTPEEQAPEQVYEYGRTEAGMVTPATLPSSAVEREDTKEIPLGADGENPVTPNNPAPKAVIKD